MATKRKISVRKILQVFLTVVVSTGCVIAIVSASRIEDGKMLSSVAVHIKNDKKYHFIEEKEIMDLAVSNRGIDVMNTPISHLDVKGMEQVICADPWVAGAQVFVDNDRVLHMYVTQRVPVVRIFGQDGNSYYMDGTMSIMPLSENYVYYTTVVTNAPEIKDDSAGQALKKQILKLVNKIQADTFWSAQISQVIVDSAGTFELMPVLGDQKILFGDTSRMADKFNNLFVFYKNVLNRIGWDKYETLDLRFKGQVVASPAMPYNGPVDKAALTMNWINSIVETEAKNDAKDSVRTVDAKAANTPVVKSTPQKADKTTKEKTKAKPVVKVEPKKTVKPQVNNNQVHHEAPPKAKGNNKDKVKKDTKEKPKKQATPKYVYPEDKSK
jgi:cell division protein FtsQ